MTWEQFEGWQRYYDQEPWGEIRADMRAMANTLWHVPGSEVKLMFPYLPDVADVVEGAKALDARKEIGPELQAKLDAIKAKHAEDVKNRGG